MGALRSCGSRDASVDLPVCWPSARSPGSNSWYTLNDDSLLERNAAERLMHTALALPLVFYLLSRDLIQPSHIEPPAVQSPNLREPENEENVVLPPAIPAEVEISLDDQCSLVYRA